MDMDYLFQTIIVYSGFALGILCFILAVKDFLIWRKAESVQAKVVGYKFYKSWRAPFRLNNFTNMISYFVPIITYDKNGVEHTTTLKNIVLATKIGETVTIKLNTDIHMSLLFFGKATLAFALFGFPAATIIATTPSEELLDPENKFMTFFLDSYPMVITALIMSFSAAIVFCFAIFSEAKKLNPRSKVKWRNVQKPPKFLKNYSTDDFKTIESQDIVSFEDMMAYNYNRNSRPKMVIPSLLFIILIIWYLWSDITETLRYL